MIPQPTAPPTESDPAGRVVSPPPSAERWGGLTPASLFLVLLVAYILIKVKLVLVLTLLAVLFATVIEAPVKALEARRVPRGLGILLIYIAIIGGIALIGVLIAPPMSDQLSQFRDQAPAQLRSLQQEWQNSSLPLLNGPGQDLLGRGIELIQQPPTPGRGTAIQVLTGLVGGVAGLLALFAIAFYYLLEKALLRRLVLLELRPEARARVSRIWDDAEAKVGGWLRGQLLLCLIIGTCATIGYGLINVRFWPLLGLWAGITEIIPIVGPWLGGVPAVLLAMTDSWEQAALVGAFIVLLQLTENIVLVPRVMKGAVGLTPLTVFVAILAGTEFMGPIGAILAIPIAALIQVVLTDYLDARRGAQRGATVILPGWRWMRGPLVNPPARPAPVEPAELARPAAPSEAPPGISPASAGPAAPPRPSGAPNWTADLLARAAAAPLPPEPITPAPPSAITPAQGAPPPARPGEPRS